MKYINQLKIILNHISVDGLLSSFRQNITNICFNISTVYQQSADVKFFTVFLNGSDWMNILWYLKRAYVYPGICFEE